LQPARSSSPARSRRRRLAALAAGALLAISTLVPSAFVYRDGAARVVDEERARPAQVIVVLGARVYPDGHLSHALADRLETALRLYRAGRAPTVLVSGADDEPGAMRRWLEARGVPPTAIVEDAGGVDTYSTMARASGTYGAATAIVVTQAFHLPRALYLGARKGVACEGVVADARRYQKAPYYQLREVFSRVRAFVDVTRGREVPLAR
jgi:vancomycin permeability regulator SanA